jgi:hypothetical protein
MAHVARSDSNDMRGRAGSSTTPAVFALNGETHGLDRVIESLKMENGDIKRAFRELDDRCNPLSFCVVDFSSL